MRWEHILNDWPKHLMSQEDQTLSWRAGYCCSEGDPGSGSPTECVVLQGQAGCDDRRRSATLKASRQCHPQDLKAVPPSRPQLHPATHKASGVLYI